MAEPWVSFTAVAVAVAVIGLASGALLRLGRRFRPMRSFRFPGFLFAVAAGLLVADRFAAPRLTGLHEAVVWVLLLAVTALTIRLLAVYFFDFILQHRRSVDLPPLVPAVTVGVAYLVAALISFKASFPAVPLGPLVATSAVTSLVLGLALQPILGNFFAGLVITLERPYRLHDWIRLGETDGQVVAINWRTTHLRTRDNDNLVVPNSEMSSSRLFNYYYPHTLHLVRITVGIHYRTPPHRAREALLAAAARVPSVLDKPTSEVYLLEFGDSSITYELRIWIENVAQQPRIASDVRTTVWEELQRRGIVIPFPIRTLEIEPRASVLQVERHRPAAPPAILPRLFVVSGAEAGRRVEMEAGVLRAGRSAESDLVLTDVLVSKLHFEIERTDEGFTLRDLGSSHGTRVNGRSVKEAELFDFDRIQAGDTEMVFETHVE